MPLSVPWKVVQRRLGRAGGQKQRDARQSEWDVRYGEGNWAIGYVIEGEFVLQETALETVYYRSYERYLDSHLDDVELLCSTARTLRNPHAEATTGVDLQVPAIQEYLRAHGLELRGNERVDIGSWEGVASHPISVKLSPLHVPCVLDPDISLEKFWQARKCLAIWADD